MRTVRGMNAVRLRGLLIGSGGLLLALPWLVGCQSGLATSPPDGPAGTAGEALPSPPPNHRPRVVQLARPQPVIAADAYPSNLYLERDVRVTARADGIIEKLLVDRGTRVKSGQALAELDTGLANGILEMAHQDQRLATADYERARLLNEQKIVSDQEFLRTKISRERAETEVSLARVRLDRCTVRAPFDGVIVERWAVVGRRVLENDNAPLFRLVASDPPRARVDVPEGRLAGLALGAKAFIELPGGGAARPAHVVFVSPAIDPASGTAPVVVEVLESADHLKPGASVSVRFENSAADMPPLLRIPRGSLPARAAGEGGAASVMVAKAGRAVARRVQVVQTQGSSITVRGDLAVDELVILAGEPALREGELVVSSEEIH